MLRRPHRLVLAAAALAVLACRGRRAPPPERFVPADAATAIVLPETGRAARDLAALHATVAGFPGAAELAGLRGNLATQLGFDPLDPDALEDAGFDPRRGAALASVDRVRAQGGEPVRRAILVLPLRDPPRVEALLQRLARDRMGATERIAEPHGAFSVVVLRAPGATAASLSYAVVERTALLATGGAGPAAVAEAAALAPEASLSQASAWASARRALGDEPSVMWWLPPGSPFLAGMWAAKDGMAAGIAAARGRLRARAALLLGAREPSFRALAADGKAAGAVGRLAPDAQLAGRWDGDFAALGKKLAPIVPAAERARLARRGIDLERDVFGVLAPGGALAISLAPGLDLSGLTYAAARADPLKAVQFELVLPVKDPAAAEATSARLAGGPPPRTRRAPGAVDGVHRIRTPSGEIAWRVDAGARRVVAAGGPAGRLEALEARLAGSDGFRPPTKSAEDALAGGLGGAVLVPPRVVAAVRAMPEEAFGTGPSGFVMRSLVDRFLEPASRITAASLRADLAEGALVLGLEVEAAEGAR
ncbi:MAG TPA: hypothetical protein VFL83_00765 [Anaeromyxobacter sp.]|nr:hypothetical protein [Anaeromyxobacter sp.]